MFLRHRAIFYIGTLLILMACVCVCVRALVLVCVCVCVHRCVYVRLGVVLSVQMGCIYMSVLLFAYVCMLTLSRHFPCKTW